jgi:nicotinate-nucleotide adenylyltransferase
MCADRRRVGVLGGTFDPVHLGHLASAREVAADLGLERVLLVLAATPPHKRAAGAAPAELRWQMLELAAREAGRDGAILEPCDMEMRRSGPSYTVDTLRELAALDPSAEIFLIVGIDAWQDVDTWSRPGEILELASVVVTTRPGREFPQGGPIPPVAARPVSRYDPAIGVHFHSSGHTLRGHRIRGIEVSATDIRRRVRAGLPVDSLTGPAVARFIAEHRLYGDGAPTEKECRD